jgi:hypothetical protein
MASTTEPKVEIQEVAEEVSEETLKYKGKEKKNDA